MKKITGVAALAWTTFALFAPGVHAEQAATSASAVASSPESSSGAKATRRANRKLELAVRRELVRTKGINVTNIFVRARDGSIVLSGTVASGEQIQRAEEVAKGVAGVTSVTNRLALSPENGS